MVYHLWICETHARIRVVLVARVPLGQGIIF